jgi:hypothetical protein
MLYLEERYLKCYNILFEFLPVSYLLPLELFLTFLNLSTAGNISNSGVIN